MLHCALLILAFLYGTCSIFSGQVCNCAERVYVQAEVYDAFVDKLVAKMKEVKFGPPKESGVEYGALISGDHRNKVQAMLDRAVADGDLEAEETTRRLLEKLEDRLVLLRRDRLRLEEEQLQSGEALRTRLKSELSQPARSTTVLRRRLRIQRS